MGLTGEDVWGGLIAYIDATLKGAGALKGKDGANCIVKSITTVDDSQVVTYQWTDVDGTVKTSTMTVKNGASAYKLAQDEGYTGTLPEWLASLKGEKGDRGYGIAGVEFDADNNIILTLDDEAGTKLPGVKMPPSKVEISKDEGNVAENRPDGFYVPKGAVEVSKDEDNALVTKPDGLFVPKVDTSNLVEKVEGKQLSTNDYTAEDKAAVDTIGDKIDKTQIVTEFSDVPSDENVPSEKLVYDSIEHFDERIDELELFKFPNTVIHGEPVINNGQISGFSALNYLAFPFMVDFHNRKFLINMAFTTGADVTSQQNIIDGKFGLALAIQNGHFVLAISTNGTSWDVGVMPGSYNVLPNSNYYLRLIYDGTQYVLAYSTDGTTYVDDITHASSSSPYPVQVYIGVGDLDVPGSEKPFLGIINLNKSNLYINDQIVWQGMDDVGLGTRLAVDLDNIDELGIEKIRKIAETEKKVDKAPGKDLSTNDYTDEDKAEVDKVKDKLDIQQSVEDKGKFLGIGENGKVTPVTGGGGVQIDDTSTDAADKTWSVKKIFNTLLSFLQKQDIIDGIIRKITMDDGVEIVSTGNGLHMQYSDNEIDLSSNDLILHNIAGGESRVSLKDGGLLLEGAPYWDKNPKINMVGGENEDVDKSRVDMSADNINLNGNVKVNNVPLENSTQVIYGGYLINGNNLTDLVRECTNKDYVERYWYDVEANYFIRNGICFVYVHGYFYQATSDAPDAIYLYSKDGYLPKSQFGGSASFQGDEDGPDAGQNFTPNGHLGYVTVGREGQLTVCIPKGFDGQSGGAFCCFSYPVKY